MVRKKRGFGIITAIIIMMIVALLMSLTMGISTQTIKQTTDVYLKQQAQLLLRSSAEFALMAISAHDNNSSCVESVTINQPPFTSKVDIWYIGRGMHGCSNILANDIKTKDSNLTVILDIVVENNISSTEPIRLHRRTIQKP